MYRPTSSWLIWRFTEGVTAWSVAFLSCGAVGADSVSLWSEGCDKWSLSVSELSETSNSDSSDCPSRTAGRVSSVF